MAKELTYNEYQLEQLKKRMSFFPKLIKYLWVVAIIISLIAALAVFFMVVGWTFIGVILSIIIIVPLLLAYVVLFKLQSYWSAIKKHKVAVASAVCNDAGELEENPDWWKHVEVEGTKLYYISSQPKYMPKKGELLHVVVTTNKSGFVFATDPIPEK